MLLIKIAISKKVNATVFAFAITTIITSFIVSIKPTFSPLVITSGKGEKL